METNLNLQEPGHHRVIDEYVDLRSKCDILRCIMVMIGAGAIDVDELDDPASKAGSSRFESNKRRQGSGVGYVPFV